MKHFTKAIVLVASLLSANAFYAQFQYGPGNWSYIDGSIFGGVALIKMPNSNPAPGFNVQYETGTSNFKFEIGFLSTLRKVKGERLGMVTSKTDGSQMNVPFESRNGYYSFGFQMRYYAFDTEEATGHNFFGGVGIGLGVVHSKITGGKYDATLYAPTDPFYNTFNGGDENNSSFVFNVGGGYQYVFDSGITLFSELRYEQGFMGDDAFMTQYYEPSKVGALSLSAGIKYIFTYDLSAWGGGYGYGGPGRRL